MSKVILIVIVLTILSGCSLIPEPETEIVYRESQIVHPPLPEPTQVRYNKPYIITKETIQKQDDNAVFQCFEYDDGQDLGIDLERSRAYVRELTAILCSYRKDLDEPLCEQYNDDSLIEKGNTDGEGIQNQN